MHMSIYMYDLPSLQTQWTFLTLKLKQPVTTEPLCLFPLLLDGIFPVLSLPSHRESVHLLHFHLLKNPKMGFPTVEKAIVQRKGGREINLKSPPTPTLSQMQPTLTAHHSNTHITHWSPFLKMSGEALYCEKGRNG